MTGNTDLLTIRSDRALELMFPSDLGVVKAAVGELRRFLERHSVTDDSGPVLVFRELVNNAIEHGNKTVHSLPVRTRIDRVSEGGFRLVVEDQGNGFEHQSLDLTLPENPAAVKNRGLALVKAFSDHVDFELGGVRVVATFSAPVHKGFEVRDDESWKTVRTLGNVTAENAETLRTLLFELMNSGYQKYRFYVNATQDIDSVGLSVFVIFANSLRKNFPNTQLELWGLHKELRTLFELTGLDRLYRMVPENRNSDA